MKRIIPVIFTIGTLIAAVQSCKKDDDEGNSTDQALYDEITSGAYTNYQGGNVLSGASPSPHGSFKLRFNGTAAAALDSTGELPTGGSFPAGSVLVKEVTSGGNITLYAVMKKDPSNSLSGSGWLWAELKTDGSVEFSTAKKGDGCISCHSGAPNRDLVRTFDLH